MAHGFFIHHRQMQHAACGLRSEQQTLSSTSITRKASVAPLKGLYPYNEKSELLRVEGIQVHSVSRTDKKTYRHIDRQTNTHTARELLAVAAVLSSSSIWSNNCSCLGYRVLVPSCDM